MSISEEEGNSSVDKLRAELQLKSFGQDRPLTGETRGQALVSYLVAIPPTHLMQYEYILVLLISSTQESCPVPLTVLGPIMKTEERLSDKPKEWDAQ